MRTLQSWLAWHLIYIPSVCVISIAAGAHTTFILATPNEKLSELERYPEVEPTEECLICNKADEDDDGATLLECEKVSVTLAGSSHLLNLLAPRSVRTRTTFTA